ncbi:Rossman fold protein, TIGR00730 family [Streptococcus azizii]|uniref:Cytokinin riboside 5'-monophosphate phosphoribohydrolase n=1 Tax=Streptococcus azizii TaxID=1579424 RepID=A0AB36JRR1_9STRE|nr:MULTISPECIES: TIGR00730 family Rossman fold protein [Streptococcus]MBF0776351.1 TIGR00730 family Rossman fold protein [Streptococcus sp. 19428wD3_AN2]ONK27089.1 Rossman fold protein, TIGR00730 family [Streptococcus azizii]ONK28442.1 Rossman fold protein, TIGR00730 family [Streptococcus azizii]ONK28522.1 Rossman fold protein, TIGR00730 family [Streptococcus azizii]TFU83129.1 TIGR00730 family Rossman fold protein [Streptococcus sp. AN2]
MKVTVYCGASLGENPLYQEGTIALGKWIAKNGHTLVYGGGNTGLMGLIADTVLAHGGQVIGVIPEFLKERELAHPRLSELRTVTTMSERKLALIQEADVFIALPGGPGTLEEISEVISWARIGKNDKPCILFTIAGYYQALEQFFDTMVTAGFLTLEDREKTLFSDEIEEIEAFIASYQPPIAREYRQNI